MNTSSLCAAEISPARVCWFVDLCGSFEHDIKTCSEHRRTRLQPADGDRRFIQQVALCVCVCGGGIGQISGQFEVSFIMRLCDVTQTGCTGLLADCREAALLETCRRVTAGQKACWAEPSQQLDPAASAQMWPHHLIYKLG